MKTCLVVDDSRVVRKIALRITAELGFKGAEAEDGQRAFDYFQQHRPDVILLDWNMPVMDGVAFLEKIRAAGGSQPKVILCTTVNDMDSIRRAIAAGADEYIIKPFDHEIMRSKFGRLGLLPP